MVILIRTAIGPIFPWADSINFMLSAMWYDWQHKFYAVSIKSFADSKYCLLSANLFMLTANLFMLTACGIRCQQEENVERPVAHERRSIASPLEQGAAFGSGAAVEIQILCHHTEGGIACRSCSRQTQQKFVVLVVSFRVGEKIRVGESR